MPLRAHVLVPVPLHVPLPISVPVPTHVLVTVVLSLQTKRPDRSGVQLPEGWKKIVVLMPVLAFAPALVHVHCPCTFLRACACACACG